MDEMDLISDSYSMEVIGVLIVERIWGKISGYLDEKRLDKRLDKMGEDIARLKGKLDK